MKKGLLIRVFFGLMIMALGGILLAHNLGIINFDTWGLFWGVFWGGLFLAAGTTALFNRGALVWGLVLCAVGMSIVLGAFGVVDVSFWKIFWPLVLVVVGLGVLFKVSPAKSKGSTDKSNEKVAIFYGEDARPKGDYDGGSLSAVFGGVNLDLRQAKVKDGAVIEIFTFCGGIEINMPSDVIVQNEVRGIFGGSEDKTVPDTKAKKTVILRGECILGGLEIK